MRRQLQQLFDQAKDTDEALDLAAEDNAPPEDLERARRESAQFLADYQALLGNLAEDARKDLERKLGNRAMRIKDRLARLP